MLNTGWNRNPNIINGAGSHNAGVCEPCVKDVGDRVLFLDTVQQDLNTLRERIAGQYQNLRTLADSIFGGEPKNGAQKEGCVPPYIGRSQNISQAVRDLFDMCSAVDDEIDRLRGL